MSEVEPLTDDDLKSLANYVAEQEEGLHGLPLVLGNGTPINRLLATIEAYKAEVEGARNAGLEAAANYAERRECMWREDAAEHESEIGAKFKERAAEAIAEGIRALKTTPTGGE